MITSLGRSMVRAAAAAVWLGALAAPAAAAPAWTDSPTLARIAQRGAVNVGYIPTPGTFAFQDAAGDTMGYSIDLCQRVIERMRQVMKRPDLRISYRPLDAAERIPLLKQSAIDLECGGNTNTATRQREVDFSYTFFTTGVRFLVRRPLVLDRSASLWRRRVAVPAGTTAQDVVNRLAREQEVQPVPVRTDADGVRLVEQGQVDAFAQDDVLLYGLLATSAQRDALAITGAFMTVEPYAFMLPKDDRVLRDLVDAAMRAAIDSGELQALYRKWFDTERLRIPMNVYMKENLRFPNRYGIP
jgi:glutamate/aspartate transport system substrate-binding protein